MSRRLSELLDAPLFLSGYSRLLIDCNRPLGAPTSIPTRSEATEIPGNHGLDAAERDRRAAAYHAPFHRRVEQALDRRVERGRPTIVLGIHSFTPVFFGAHQVVAGVVMLAAILGLTIGTSFAFARVRPLAAWLLVPYIAWISFALALTMHIQAYNPDAERLAPGSRTTQML